MVKRKVRTRLAAEPIRNLRKKDFLILSFRVTSEESSVVGEDCHAPSGLAMTEKG